MNLTLILLAVPALAAMALLWAKWRASRHEPYHCCRCPDCGQKVRYLASKASRAGECPRCRQRWILPATPGQVPRLSSPSDTARSGRHLWRSIRLATVSASARRSQ